MSFAYMQGHSALLQKILDGSKVILSAPLPLWHSEGGCVRIEGILIESDRRSDKWVGILGNFLARDVYAGIRFCV